MGCGSGSCGTTKEGEEPAGCGSKGGCSTGGCNKNNVSDWLADMPLSFNENFNIVEVAFKKGSRKGFYRNTTNLDMHKGQLIVVEAAQGFDIGEVSLQGELVKVQMKKNKITERDDTIRNILRVASESDINTFLDGRNKENETMVRARAIAKTHNLQMKIGDVEYQGDGKKVTMYYTADDRVDFRELVKVFARDFKVKIEMRQIGARQEAARIGGMGTCGRELCCSTWLQDFKSVTTQAVRYQNLAINTEKMSGQCGRLKCCLNYELDTYNDALKKFPKNVDKIETEEGTATLRKTEILKKLMWFEYEGTHGNPIKIDVETVAELIWMNKQGKKPATLGNYHVVENVVVDESKHDDLVGQVSLSTLMEKDRKNRNNKGRSNNSRGGQGSRDNRGGGGRQQEGRDPESKPQQENRNRPPQGDRKPQGDRPKQEGNRNQQGGNRNKPQGDRNKPPQGDRPKQEGNRNQQGGNRNKPQGDRNKPQGDRPENKGPQPPQNNDNNPA
jgi:cell fate regulator YaaT (PSP1 superfamily)